MATKDNNSGFLSKMAKFVRNPTTGWAELDKPEPESELEQESGYGKLALKEMIERKRQNDFVRRREFDQLRKLRRKGLLIKPDVTSRPSFFQGSTTSNLDERAMTLKKIDEIEAQMSKQWWKGKQDESVHGGNFPVAANRRRATDDRAPTGVAAREGTPTFATTQGSGGSLNFGQEQGADYEPTQIGSAAPDEPVPIGAPRQIKLLKSSGSRNFDGGISGFSESKLFSVELGDDLADPDLEEAAIRFANGDDAGAEAGLLAALQADKVHPDSADGWAAALFDLYRSTGQQASFDRVAIDFAQRFGHSAPAWFSTPELLGRKAAASPSPSPSPRAVASAQRSQTIWECPAELDLQAVQALRASLMRATVPWHLNWGHLQTITPDAGKALAELFAEWCSQPVKLHFDGVDVLQKTLLSSTPLGDQRVDVCWWQLRLDALRILHLQDEFELVALDFCVTYEVSPSSWEDARCEYVHERFNSTLPAAQARGLPGDTAASGTADVSPVSTAPIGLDEEVPTAVVELTGEVLGDAAEALDKLQAELKGASRLVISCARLIRVDFSAAGSILNWVAVRESEGCQVQFRDVPRLVAAFFNVIGINEHARVILRNS